MKRLFVSAIIFLLLFSGCKKDSMDNDPSVHVRFITGISLVGPPLFGSIPQVPQMNLFVDGIWESPDVSMDLSRYAKRIDPGIHRMLIRTAPVDTVVMDTSYTFEQGGYYTIIVSKFQDKRYWSTIVRDDLTVPKGDYIGVRVFHLSDKTGLVDVFADEQRIFGNRAFGDIITSPDYAGFVTTQIGKYGRAPDFYFFKAGTTDTLTSLKRTYYWRPGQLLTVLILAPTDPALNAKPEIMLLESNHL